jgi:hypothetical protein
MKIGMAQQFFTLELFHVHGQIDGAILTGASQGCEHE